MPENFDDLLTGIAESGARAAGESGAPAARARGRQRTVRRRAAAATLSLVLLGGAAGIAAAATVHDGGKPLPVTHTGTPTPAPTTGPSMSTSAAPSRSDVSGSPSASNSPSTSTTRTTTIGDLDTVVPAAWVPVSAFPLNANVKWTAEAAQPAIHGADRQWFSSCLGGRLSTTGALGFQELTANSGNSGGEADSADQVVFFYGSTAVAQSALATIAESYATCPRSTVGLDDKPITDTLTRTGQIDGGYAWVHTFVNAQGNPDAPADHAPYNHEYFVQRGDTVEMVWLGGYSPFLASTTEDLQFLGALAASLCTYGGTCGP